jgi:hypothetical protein
MRMARGEEKLYKLLQISCVGWKLESDALRTYALQNEKSCQGGFIQTLGNPRKISKKTRPYDGLGSDCVSPNTAISQQTAQ